MTNSQPSNIITIQQLLEKNSQQFGGSLAFQIRDESGYRQYTYQQVAEVAQKLQQALIVVGVVKGSRVAILSENRPEWPITYLAIAAMGAVTAPLDAMLKKEDILSLLEDAEPKVVVISKKYVEFVQGGSFANRVILMEDFHQLSVPLAQPLPPVSLDDLASIVYTSGTTGTPKGVMLTHKNLMSNALTGASLFEIGPGDNLLSILPLHHTFESTGGFLAPFSRGCSITYAESLKSHNLLRNMQETGVTLMCGVPLLYQLFYEGILREVEEQGKGKIFQVLFSLSRFFINIVGINIGRKLFAPVHKKFGGKIRFFVSGGAALDPELQRNFELMGFTILQGYGLTEASPILTANSLSAKKIGAAGKTLPGVQIRIVGDGPTGEILAYGPNIMKGYYKRKDLTAEVIDNTGWLHTGDVGYFDDGFLFITGRCKDVIVTSAGVNVYPEEIEPRLNRLPEVKESCILGAKIKAGVRKGAEEVVAIVVPSEGTTEEQVKAAVQALNKSLAEFKRIARVIFRKEELPKTRLLKIKRFALRKDLDH